MPNYELAQLFLLRKKNLFNTQKSIVAPITASIISQEDLLKCIGAIGLNTIAAAVKNSVACSDFS